LLNHPISQQTPKLSFLKMKPYLIIKKQVSKTLKIRFQKKSLLKRLMGFYRDSTIFSHPSWNLKWIRNNNTYEIVW